MDISHLHMRENTLKLQKRERKSRKNSKTGGWGEVFGN